MICAHTVVMSSKISMVSRSTRHHATISLVCIVSCKFVAVVTSRVGVCVYPEGVDMGIVAVLTVGVGVDVTNSAVIGGQVSYCIEVLIILEVCTCIVDPEYNIDNN